MESLPICTHCGFTWGEYRSRGLLGCPHCYASFGEALQGDLIWIHRALAQTAPAPGPGGGAVSGSAHSAADEAAGLREQLADAVRREDFAEAARLQKLLREGLSGRNGDRGPG